MKITRRRKAGRVGDADHKCPVAGFDYDVYKSFASQTFDVVVVVVAQAFPFASSSFSHQQS
jgi:hypothetical protein